MTPSGIEPATLRFVPQHLNQCATAVPLQLYSILFIFGCFVQPKHVATNGYAVTKGLSTEYIVIIVQSSAVSLNLFHNGLCLIKCSFCTYYMLLWQLIMISYFRWRNITNNFFFFFLWRCGPTQAMTSPFLRFLDNTQRRTTVGRTPLDEWSVRRRDLYLTTHNTHNRQTSMAPVGFEPTISPSERPQTYALDRVATGTGTKSLKEENM